MTTKMHQIKAYFDLNFCILQCLFFSQIYASTIILVIRAKALRDHTCRCVFLIIFYELIDDKYLCVRWYYRLTDRKQAEYIMDSIFSIKKQLRDLASIPKEKQSIFFKTGFGHYAEHDQFIGVTVPRLRQLGKAYQNLTLEELHLFLESPFNEERLFALLILVDQYKKAGPQAKEKLYQFYLNNINYVNNWNLVDASAHLIIGAHLLGGNRALLFTLARSKILWERRIAIVSTGYFIRNDDLTCTFQLAKLLLKDSHDLIHKAVGWMLREAGKKDQSQLTVFLNQYAIEMPRTMLRYSIEKFPEVQRRAFLTASLKSRLISNE